MNVFRSALIDRPAVVNKVFDSAQGGLNLLLPGAGEFHSRYSGIGSVGLAYAAYIPESSAVNECADPSDGPNPLNNPGFQPDYYRSNQEAHPEAWRGVPAEFLYGEITTLEQFEFMVRAKFAGLLASGRESSFDKKGVNISRGVAGFAGGRRRSSSGLVVYSAVSGLWEPHDAHVEKAITADSILVATGKAKVKTPDQYADDFENTFGLMRSRHAGAEAEDLNRHQVGTLLKLEGLL